MGQKKTGAERVGGQQNDQRLGGWNYDKLHLLMVNEPHLYGSFVSSHDKRSIAHEWRLRQSETLSVQCEKFVLQCLDLKAL